MIEHLWKLFLKPFKSRLFIIVFFLIFIPVGTFGINYSMLSSSFVWSWDNVFSLYTPEALFTYIVPLLVTVLIDGVIALINQYKNIEDNTYKHDLLRDCTVLGVVVLIIIITLLYISLSQNKISLIVFCVVVTWGLWIMLSSSKEEFKPTAKWKPDGDKDDTSMEAITNG